MGRPDQTHLEETVEKMGLLIVWLLGYLGISEEKAREGVAQLAKEQAEADEKLARELGEELGKVLETPDPRLNEQLKRTRERARRRRRR